MTLLGTAPLAQAAEPPRPPPVDSDGFVLQLGWNNSARLFAGLVQIGLHVNQTRQLYGVGQVGLWNSALQFIGVGQLGVQNLDYRLFIGIAQVGVHNYHRAGFIGVAQLGAYNQSERDFFGGAQIGVYNEAGREFYAAAQIGLWNVANGFIGGFQLGVVNRKSDHGDFMGPSQFGLVNSVEESFAGSVVGQIGLFNYTAAPYYAPFQLGVVNAARRFFGLLQAAAINLSEDSQMGVQLGLFNWDRGKLQYVQLGVVNGAHELRGIQLGLFNYAGQLTGIQIGLLNRSRSGGLPVSPILNWHF